MQQKTSSTADHSVVDGKSPAFHAPIRFEPQVHGGHRCYVNWKKSTSKPGRYMVSSPKSEHLCGNVCSTKTEYDMKMPQIGQIQKNNNKENSNKKDRIWYKFQTRICQRAGYNMGGAKREKNKKFWSYLFLLKLVKMTADIVKVEHESHPETIKTTYYQIGGNIFFIICLCFKDN